jgi:hypothetical protein
MLKIRCCWWNIQNDKPDCQCSHEYMTHFLSDCPSMVWIASNTTFLCCLQSDETFILTCLHIFMCVYIEYGRERMKAKIVKIYIFATFKSARIFFCIFYAFDCRLLLALKLSFLRHDLWLLLDYMRAMLLGVSLGGMSRNFFYLIRKIV